MNICMYICMYIYIYIYVILLASPADTRRRLVAVPNSVPPVPRTPKPAPNPLVAAVVRERGSAPERVRHSTIFVSPNASVQWQPDGLAIPTKKWFLRAGFLGAPPISPVKLSWQKDLLGCGRSGDSTAVMFLGSPAQLAAGWALRCRRSEVPIPDRAGQG